MSYDLDEQAEYNLRQQKYMALLNDGTSATGSTAQEAVDKLVGFHLDKFTGEIALKPCVGSYKSKGTRDVAIFESPQWRFRNSWKSIWGDHRGQDNLKAISELLFNKPVLLEESPEPPPIKYITLKILKRKRKARDKHHRICVAVFGKGEPDKSSVLYEVGEQWYQGGGLIYLSSAN